MMWHIVAIMWSPEGDVAVTLGDYELVTYQNLAAIVIRSRYERIDDLPICERVDALFNYESILERASINNRILLPVRFGTKLRSKKDIVMTLQRNARRFRSLLQYAEDKAEFDLMGIWKETIGEVDHNIFEDLENRGYSFKVHQPANRAICFHLSILMTPDEQAMFAEIKKELDQRLGDRIDLRLSEPLPPYSFFTLDLKEGMGQEAGELMVSTIKG